MSIYWGAPQLLCQSVAIVDDPLQWDKSNGLANSRMRHPSDPKKLGSSISVSSVNGWSGCNGWGAPSVRNQMGLQIIICNMHRMSIYLVPSSPSVAMLIGRNGWVPVSEKSNGLANNNIKRTTRRWLMCHTQMAHSDGWSDGWCSTLRWLMHYTQMVDAPHSDGWCTTLRWFDTPQVNVQYHGTRINIPGM